METVSYNAKADQWRADCEAAGYRQMWADIAAQARAQGEPGWYLGAAAWLAVWALLLLFGAMVA